MLPPLIPVLTWFTLLVKYPQRTLAVAIPLLTVLLTLAVWVQWQEKSNERLLAQLQMTLEYAPDECPADMPLLVRVDNTSGRALETLSWRIAAYRPGERTNLVEERYNSPSCGTTALRMAGTIRWRPASTGNIACRCPSCAAVIALLRWSSASKTARGGFCSRQAVPARWSFPVEAG